jgi:hypothetical protein
MTEYHLTSNFKSRSGYRYPPKFLNQLILNVREKFDFKLNVILEKKKKGFHVFLILLIFLKMFSNFLRRFMALSNFSFTLTSAQVKTITDKPNMAKESSFTCKPPFAEFFLRKAYI